MKIKTITQNKIENRYGKNNPAFTGVLDAATAGLMLCNKFPMIGVAVKDTVSTNVPRSIEDYKEYGFAAARETAWREFSGLFVNCLIPSLFVLGSGAAVNKAVMGPEFKNINMAGSWANQETLEKFAQVFKTVPKEIKTRGTDAQAKHFVESIFSGLEGLKENEWVKFSDILNHDEGKKAVNILINAISNPDMGRKATKKAVKEAYKTISNITGATETLRFTNDSAKIFSSNLSELIRDQVDLGRKFTLKNVGENIDTFVKKATKTVNIKSLLGLAVVIPLAMSMQYINRAITKKQYGKDGPPVYKDFEKRKAHKLNSQEKRKLNFEKTLSIAAMLGLSLLSMMKKPNMKMFQFKGIFPTVDQCRGVATSTFVSRLLASENLKELGMNRRRDMGSFACLYFLGDYVSKGVATLIEKIKPDIKLLNRIQTIEPNANIFKKFGNWVTNTKLKSFDEVKGKQGTNMRSLCELADLSFSMLGLGVLLTKYNNAKAEKFDKKQAEINALKKTFDTDTKLDDTTRFGDKFSQWNKFTQNKAFSGVANECFK